jgi:hypothetical protein
MDGDTYDFALYTFSGEDTAERLFESFCEQDRTKRIDIRTAAVAFLRPDGRLQLVHKLDADEDRVTVLGFILGVLAGGPVAVALAGELVGPARLKWRRTIDTPLERHLRSDRSALAIIISSVDWPTFDEAADHIVGIPIMAELTLETIDHIHELIEKDGITEAIGKVVVEVIGVMTRD